MKKGTNEQIVQSWIDNKPMAHSSGRLRTNGHVMTSYDLVIGTTDFTEKGVSHKILGDYTGVGGDYCSQTTSEHVGMIKGRSGVWIIEPSEFTRLYAPGNVEVIRKQRHSTESVGLKEWKLQTQGDYR